MKKLAIVSVEMFGEIRECLTDIYGPKLGVYRGDNVYWVERGEDMYGIDQKIKEGGSFCVVLREHWMNGKLIGKVEE